MYNEAMSPRISVIVPAFNEAKLIEQCLVSLKNQHFDKDQYEIIVVDNNSTDETAVIAKKMEVQVYVYADKRNAGAVRQYGVSKSKGEILAFLDADSVAPKTWLSQINEAFTNDSTVCIGGSVWPTKTRNTTTMKTYYRMYHWLLLIHQMVGIVLPWGLNMAVRKSAFEKVQGFNPKLEMSEDWDLALRLQETYGRRNVRYIASLKVFTSPRKASSFVIFFTSLKKFLINYVTVVLRRKSKASRAIYVR
jgi:glycosyltransferase involved in cell wall biosynthesis